LVDALEAVESVFNYDIQASVCPWCKAVESLSEGLEHKPNCQRQKALEVYREGQTHEAVRVYREEGR